MEQCQVTVVCMAYNQESYIEDALKGFVSQKTNFPFKVLVHDDKSTDTTAQIIKKYESLYPDIIVGLYEDENLYSKGDGVLHSAISAHVDSKYVALCEGDDYWTDSYKLQKQYDAMEKNPDVDICACAGKAINATTNEILHEVKPKEKDCIIPPDEVIAGKGDYVITAGLFMKSDIYINGLPYCKNFFVDYIYQIAGSLNAGMLFLSDSMCNYRMFAKGSWTVSTKNKSRIILNNMIIDMLKKVDINTNYKFTKSINKEISHLKYTNNWMSKKYLKAVFSKHFLCMPLKNKLKIIFKKNK